MKKNPLSSLQGRGGEKRKKQCFYSLRFCSLENDQYLSGTLPLLCHSLPCSPFFLLPPTSSLLSQWEQKDTTRLQLRVSVPQDPPEPSSLVMLIGFAEDVQTRAAHLLEWQTSETLLKRNSATRGAAPSPLDHCGH